jgi:hypothetical protein
LAVTGSAAGSAAAGAAATATIATAARANHLGRSPVPAIQDGMPDAIAAFPTEACP